MPTLPQAVDSAQNATLQLVGMRALLLTRGSSAAIALGNQEGMVCAASIGRSAPPIGCHLDVSSGFSGECVRTRAALRCDDSETDCRVDAESCRQLGIRSILAAPIPSGAEVVGILEVFSPEPSAFDDSCLALLERLAQTAAPPRARITTAPPKLLVELEPAHRVFWRNLSEALFPPRVAPLKRTSLPARFWPDVFVPTQLPWRRFVQSLAMHAVVLCALGLITKFVAFEPDEVRPQPLNDAVVYYTPAEYRQLLAARKVSFHASTAGQNGWVVSPETEAPAATPAPNVRLTAQSRSLPLMSPGAPLPEPPLAAATELRLGPGLALVEVVGPAPKLVAPVGGRGYAGLGSAAVIGPPPQTSGLGEARALTGMPTRIVEPPPALHQVAGRGNGTGFAVGEVEAVGPAPQLPADGGIAASAVVEAALHAAITNVIPPPPVMKGEVGIRPTPAMKVGLPAAILRNADAGAATPSGPGAPEAASAKPAAERQEVSVNFVGLALSLPSSSYFSSQEIFLAQEKLGRSQWRLIKLVYEYLPYQQRLSDFGPDYPDIDKLRVTRDPGCDELLGQIVSRSASGGRALNNRLQAMPGFALPAGRLECYRTTADDYLRARTHRR